MNNEIIAINLVFLMIGYLIGSYHRGTENKKIRNNISKNTELIMKKLGDLK